MATDPNTTTELPEPLTEEAVQSVIRFMRILRHRWMYVAAAIVIAGLFGGLYYFTETPIYEARASLLVTQTSGNTVSDSLTGSGGPTALLPTYQRLLTSAVVLEGAVQRLKQHPKEMLVDLAPYPKDEWKDILKNNLTASAERRAHILGLSYRSLSPRAAEVVVNTVVDSYLDFMDQHHKDVSIEVMKILDKERVQVETQLTQKNVEFLAAKRSARDLATGRGPDVTHPTVKRVFDLGDALTEVSQRRFQLDSSLQVIETAIMKGHDLRQYMADLEPVVGKELVSNALGVNPQTSEFLHEMERKLIADRAKLETFSGHLGPRHPDVVELTKNIQKTDQYLATYQLKINERLANISNGQLAPMLLSLVRQRVDKARAHEAELARQYKIAEDEALQLDDRLAKLQLVEHDLNRLRRLHETLLNRLNQIEIRDHDASVRVEPVSAPAASDDPVWPSLPLIALLCLAAGTGAGVVLVYLMDLLDERFRSPEELTEQLGLPILAIVRDLPKHADSGAGAIHVHVAPESVESEAFRTLRTTLTFSGQESDRLAITSTEPSDGKTTILANLAVSFAIAGKRTVVIDADMRKPGLSRLFGMRGLPGLSDILRENDRTDEHCRDRVQSTGIDGLDLIPCGPKALDPAELLIRPSFAQVVAWAESNYDQVLIDCPPLLAASDAMIIGHATDGLMIVVQPDKNHRRQVIRAVQGLRTMPVNLVGIIANRVGDSHGNYGYGAGYGTGYGYGVGYGYGDDDDEYSDDHNVIPLHQETTGGTFPRRRRVA